MPYEWREGKNGHQRLVRAGDNVVVTRVSEAKPPRVVTQPRKPAAKKRRAAKKPAAKKATE